METEILTDAELAKRFREKSKRWVQRNSRPWLVDDPIPAIRFGKSYRYLWGSPELTAWIARRTTTAQKMGRAARKAKT